MATSPFLEVPESQWLAHNDLAFAIFDRYPVSRGHVLVVTRRTIPNWLAASPEERAALVYLVDEILTTLKRDYGPDGFNVGFNVGVAAGQTVEHMHVHVIPRYSGDVADPTGGVRHVIPDKANYLR